MEKLKYILRNQTISSDERGSAERLISAIENKDREQAEIVYFNYKSHADDLTSYVSSSPANPILKIEMDGVYSRLNLFNWKK